MTAERSVELSGTAEGPWGRSAVELARWSAGVLVGLLTAAAVLIGWRRLAGALHRPLEPLVLLLAGALVAAAAAGIRILWQHLPAIENTRPRRWPVWLLTSVAVLGLAAALLEFLGETTRNL